MGTIFFLLLVELKTVIDCLKIVHINLSWHSATVGLSCELHQCLFAVIWNRSSHSHEGQQEVSMVTGMNFRKCPTYTPPQTTNKAAHSDFETQNALKWRLQWHYHIYSRFIFEAIWIVQLISIACRCINLCIIVTTCFKISLVFTQRHSDWSENSFMMVVCENFSRLLVVSWTKNSDSTLKKNLIDNHYKTIFRSEWRALHALFHEQKQ